MRRTKGRLLAGLWEFPEVGEPASLGVGAHLEKTSVGTIRHTILDRRIETRVFSGTVNGTLAAHDRHMRWFHRRRLHQLPLSAATLRITRDLLEPLPAG